VFSEAISGRKQFRADGIETEDAEHREGERK
jgi:hypothetical protein